jgi:hypothetical protein
MGTAAVWWHITVVWRRALLVSVGVAAAVSGCGGSGDGQLTAAQLASQGNAICRRAAAEEQALYVSSASSARLELSHIGEIVTRELAELHKLVPPASEQNAYAALLHDFSQLNGLLKPLSSSLASTGSAPPNLLSRGRQLTSQAAAIAVPLGLEQCSKAAPGQSQ